MGRSNKKCKVGNRIKREDLDNRLVLVQLVGGSYAIGFMVEFNAASRVITLTNAIDFCNGGDGYVSIYLRHRKTFCDVLSISEADVEHYSEYLESVIRGDTGFIDRVLAKLREKKSCNK